MVRLYLLALLFFAISITITTAIQCNPRDYGHGSSVCVCSEQLKCEDMKVKLSKQVGTVSSYVTSKGGARFKQQEYHFTKEASPISTPSHVEVDVNQTKRYQKIIGFGGTLTDSAAIMISKLPKSLQERLIRDFFSDEGLGYNLCRVPIGATDASTRGYSLDDHPEGETLSKFALQPEDNLRIALIQMVKGASSRPVKLFASAWSPPAWMKTNRQLNYGGELIGRPGEKYYKLFAKYLIRFVQEYKKHNASMWGMTVLNEPNVCHNDPFWLWPCLNMNGTVQRDFIKLDLGPELRSSDVASTILMAYDWNLNDIVNFDMPIFTDKEAAKYVDGIAFHWYEANEKNRQNLQVLAESLPDKFLLATEASQGHPGKEHVLLGDWDMFNHYADDIIKDLNLHSTGWVDWSLAFDTQGGPNWANNFIDATVTVNESSHEYYKQTTFYAMGHFSKFILPDSVRVQHHAEVSERPDNLLVTVFVRPDNATVVTVLNKNTYPVALKLHDRQKGHLTVELLPESLESLIYY